jgi:hypothetical protein
MFQDADLYYYDLKSNRLTKIADLQEVTRWVRAWRDSYDMFIAFDDTAIYYRWLGAFRLRKMAHGPDSLEVARLMEKMDKMYRYNLLTHQTSEVDSAVFYSVFNRLKDRNRVDMNTEYDTIYALIKKLPLSALEIPFDSVFSVSKNDLLSYIVYNEGGYWVHREIMEKTVPTLSKRQIRKVLEEMERYKNNLERKAGSSYKNRIRYTGYKEYYEHTSQKLKSFL